MPDENKRLAGWAAGERIDERMSAMVEQMTTALLWTMAVLGAWNGLNMVGRFYYRAPWWPYAWCRARSPSRPRAGSA